MGSKKKAKKATDLTRFLDLKETAPSPKSIATHVEDTEIFEPSDLSYYRLLLSPHDFLAFSSFGDYNNLVHVDAKFIGNYALLFAFQGKSHYYADSTIPSYKTDLDSLSYYITPASALTGGKPKKSLKGIYGNELRLNGRQEAIVKITHNSITETFRAEASREKTETFMVTYEKIPPTHLFECFAITHPKWKFYRIIRLGKKSATVRVFIEPLKFHHEVSGEYFPSHVVNGHEIASDQLIDGIIHRTIPAPLISHARLNGRFVIVERNRPKSRKYCLLIPSKLQFVA